MRPEPTLRLRVLDLVRGVAVLGILAVNITGFAAPDGAAISPDLPRPSSLADHFAWIATLVLVEGKMRALFSLLFGASLLLFIERAEAAGRNGLRLQVRRLGWLLVLGYLHFALLWDGDILFVYAAIGFAALGFRHLSAGHKLIGALLALALWQAWSTAMWAPSLANEAAVTAGQASPSAQRRQADAIAAYRADDAANTAEAQSGWAAETAEKLADRPAYPLILAFYNWGETLAFMLLGMALLQAEFFSGRWSTARLRQLAVAGLVLGGGASLAFALWARGAHYPEIALRYALSYGLAFAHLAMALGYGALLVLAAPHLLASRIGARLEAAGRMAFSNYIATSAVMTFLFHGWGLGLFGQFGAASRWPFVLLGWLLMLGWSAPWLARFRQGPLEWAWRSLTEQRLLPFRR